MNRKSLLVFVIFLSLGMQVLAKPGDIGSDWTLSTPDGGSVTLCEDVSKQATVLFFWASWCPYCKGLMPHLQSIRFEYGDAVNILAINIFEDGDPVAVIEDAGYDFTLLLEGDVEAGDYGITGTPGVLVLDRNRVIQFDLRALPRVDPPNMTDKTDHRKKSRFQSAVLGRA